jgi:hypothetical protein
MFSKLSPLEPVSFLAHSLSNMNVKVVDFNPIIMILFLRYPIVSFLIVE